MPPITSTIMACVTTTDTAGRFYDDIKKPRTARSGAFFFANAIRRGRNDPHSSPWSRPRQNPSRTFPARRAGIDLGQGPQLRVRAEDQIGAGAGPFDLAGLAVAGFEDVWVDFSSSFHSVPISSRLTKKSFVSTPATMGEDAMLRAMGVCAQHAQAAHQHRHFRRAQPQELGTIQQQLLGRNADLAAMDIVAEAVSHGFQHGEGFDIGLFLRSRPCGWG